MQRLSVIPKEALVFHYVNDGEEVLWTWEVEPYKKIFWKTWKPKLENVKIISDLKTKKEYNRIKKEIYEEVMNREFPKKTKPKRTAFGWK